MYPIEALVEYGPSNARWFEYLYRDRAFIHTVLFTTKAFFDCVRDAKLGNTTLLHFTNALGRLRYNLLESIWQLPTPPSLLSCPWP
jgi:hypothetical protein